jgi:hypothetical protein
VLLDPSLRKYADLVEVGQSAAPSTTHSQTLDAFPVFQLEIPNFVPCPFIERPELNVGALSPLCSLI